MHFYVYGVKFEGEIIYLGKGKQYRSKQSCKRFEKLLGTVSVEILLNNLTEEQAFQLESKLIEEMKPRYNRTSRPIGRRVRQYDNTITWTRALEELQLFGRVPSRTAGKGSYEYRLKRRLDAFRTKTNASYSEEGSKAIEDMLNTFKQNKVNEKRTKVDEITSKREQKLQGKISDCLVYIKEHGKLPKGKEDSPLYSFVVDRFYPSSPRFNLQFRMLLLSALDKVE